MSWDMGPASPWSLSFRSHVHGRGGRADTDHLEQEQSSFVAQLPTGINVAAGGTLQGLPGVMWEIPSWGLELASTLMGNSTIIHEFLKTHMGTVFCNGHQAFLHWFIGEEMDGVEFTKVESGRTVWCWNTSRAKKLQLTTDKRLLKMARKRSMNKGVPLTQILKTHGISLILYNWRLVHSNWMAAGSNGWHSCKEVYIGPSKTRQNCNSSHLKYRKYTKIPRDWQSHQTSGQMIRTFYCKIWNNLWTINDYLNKPYFSFGVQPRLRFSTKYS